MSSPLLGLNSQVLSPTSKTDENPSDKLQILIRKNTETRGNLKLVVKRNYFESKKLTIRKELRGK